MRGDEDYEQTTIRRQRIRDIQFTRREVTKGREFGASDSSGKKK